MRTLTAIGLALGMSILGAQAQAACNHGNVPYDYFNANPLIIRSGQTCQEVTNLQAQYGGTTSPTSAQIWSWQGVGCGAAGSGQDLANAAVQLMVWGCQEGTLTNMSNGTEIPY